MANTGNGLGQDPHDPKEKPTSPRAQILALISILLAIPAVLIALFLFVVFAMRS